MNVVALIGWPVAEFGFPQSGSGAYRGGFWRDSG